MHRMDVSFLRSPFEGAFYVLRETAQPCVRLAETHFVEHIREVATYWNVVRGVLPKVP